MREARFPRLAVGSNVRRFSCGARRTCRETCLAHPAKQTKRNRLQSSRWRNGPRFLLANRRPSAEQTKSHARRDQSVALLPIVRRVPLLSSPERLQCEVEERCKAKVPRTQLPDTAKFS